MPVLIEQFKITHKDFTIESGQIQRRPSEISSKPVGLQEGKYYVQSWHLDLKPITT